MPCTTAVPTVLANTAVDPNCTREPVKVPATDIVRVAVPKFKGEVVTTPEIAPPPTVKVPVVPAVTVPLWIVTDDSVAVAEEMLLLATKRVPPIPVPEIFPESIFTFPWVAVVKAELEMDTLPVESRPEFKTKFPVDEAPFKKLTVPD